MVSVAGMVLVSPIIPTNTIYNTILKRRSNGGGDSITDKAILQKYCAALQLRIAELEADVIALQTRDSYQLIQEI